jgi:hypothetical protein
VCQAHGLGVISGAYMPACHKEQGEVCSFEHAGDVLNAASGELFCVCV